MNKAFLICILTALVLSMTSVWAQPEKFSVKVTGVDWNGTACHMVGNDGLYPYDIILAAGNPITKNSFTITVEGIAGDYSSCKIDVNDKLFVIPIGKTISSKNFRIVEGETKERRVVVPYDKIEHSFRLIDVTQNADACIIEIGSQYGGLTTAIIDVGETTLVNDVLVRVTGARSNSRHPNRDSCDIMIL